MPFVVVLDGGGDEFAFVGRVVARERAARASCAIRIVLADGHEHFARVVHRHREHQDA